MMKLRMLKQISGCLILSSALLCACGVFAWERRGIPACEHNQWREDMDRIGSIPSTRSYNVKVSDIDLRVDLEARAIELRFADGREPLRNTYLSEAETSEKFAEMTEVINKSGEYVGVFEGSYQFNIEKLGADPRKSRPVKGCLAVASRPAEIKIT